MAAQSLTWRRSAATAAAGLGATWIATSGVVFGFSKATEFEDSAIGAATLTIFVGFPVSVAFYFLVGGAILRTVATRLNGAISTGRAILVLGVAGLVFFVVGAPLSSAVGDNHWWLEEVVFYLSGYAAGVVAGTLVMRWIGPLLLDEPADGRPRTQDPPAWP
jgi:hypothetical protein